MNPNWSCTRCWRGILLQCGDNDLHVVFVINLDVGDVVAFKHAMVSISPCFQQVKINTSSYTVVSILIGMHINVKVSDNGEQLEVYRTPHFSPSSENLNIIT